MNLFVIPSWYPSADNKLAGLFIKEQTLVLADKHQINIGISCWGQNDNDYLLWSGDHLKNIPKLLNASGKKFKRIKLRDNCVEYHTSAFTWTRKILNGNINKIVKSNKENLNHFRNEFGNIDVIIAHMGYPGGYIANQLSAEFGIPYVIIENMSPFPFDIFITPHKTLVKPLIRAYQGASLNIAVSNHQKFSMQRFGIKNLDILPNFIRDEAFYPDAKKRSGDYIKLLFIGRLEHQKGVDVLLQSMKLLDLKNNKMSLTIVGNGSLEKQLKSLTDSLEISEHIHWMGLKLEDDIPEIIRAHDIFILPSRHESFGIVCLEAMASGLPCVVTKCGGPEDIITNEVGILVDKENPKMLSQAIQKLADTLPVFEKEKIRNYYEEHFSSKKITQQLIQSCNSIRDKTI